MDNQVSKKVFCIELGRRTGWHPSVCRAIWEAGFSLISDYLKEGKDVNFPKVGEFRRHLQEAQEHHGVAEGYSSPDRYLAKFYSHSEFDAPLNEREEGVNIEDEALENEWE